MRQRKLLLPPFQGSAVKAFREVIREVAEAEVGALARRRRVPDARADAGAHLRGDLPGGVRRHRAGADRAPALGAAPRHRPRGVHVSCPSGCGARGSRPARAPGAALRAPPRAPPTRCSTRRSPGGAVRRDLDERTDVLSLLLRARDEDGRPMTDVELRDELMTMLAAGHETTATALAFAFELLLRNPEALSRLRDELGCGRRRLPRGCRHREPARPARHRRQRAHTHQAPGRRRLGAAGRDPRLPRRSCSSSAARTSTPRPERFRPERFLDGARRVLRLASVRRRHPPLHRRRPRPGRDGRGDPRRRPASRARGRSAPQPDPVVHARHHPGAQARDPGAGLSKPACRRRVVILPGDGPARRRGAGWSRVVRGRAVPDRLRSRTFPTAGAALLVLPGARWGTATIFVGSFCPRRPRRQPTFSADLRPIVGVPGPSAGSRCIFATFSVQALLDPRSRRADASPWATSRRSVSSRSRGGSAGRPASAARPSSGPDACRRRGEALAELGIVGKSEDGAKRRRPPVAEEPPAVVDLKLLGLRLRSRAVEEAQLAAVVQLPDDRAELGSSPAR